MVSMPWAMRVPTTASAGVITLAAAAGFFLRTSLGMETYLHLIPELRGDFSSPSLERGRVISDLARRGRVQELNASLPSLGEAAKRTLRRQRIVTLPAL